MLREILLWTAAFLVFVALCYGGWLWRRKRDRDELRKEIDLLLPQLETGDHVLATTVKNHRQDELNLMRAWRLKLDSETRDRLVKIWSLLYALSGYQEKHAKLNGIFKEYRETVAIIDRARGAEILRDLMVALNNCNDYTRKRLGDEWEFSTSPEDLKEALAQQVVLHADHLWYTTNDQRSIQEYFAFMSSWEHEVEGLSWPENWRDLVLEEVPLPSLELLRMEKDPIPEEQDVLWLAAVAIKQKDYRTAKVVIAYLSHDPERFVFIGESIALQLALVIAEDDIQADESNNTP